jgi:hypothetical protein
MWYYVPLKERPRLDGNVEMNPGPHHLTFVNQFFKWDRQLRKPRCGFDDCADGFVRAHRTLQQIPSESSGNAFNPFAASNAEQAAQQARDAAAAAQQQRESNAAQHIMQMSNLSQNEAEGLVHEAMPPDR